MQLFFLNSADKDVAEKEPLGFQLPNPGPVNPNPSKRKWYNILAEQVINSAIVGGIAGLSALSASPEASWKTAIIASGLTFLIELRKYRTL